VSATPAQSEDDSTHSKYYAPPEGAQARSSHSGGPNLTTESQRSRALMFDEHTQSQKGLNGLSGGERFTRSFIPPVRSTALAQFAAKAAQMRRYSVVPVREVRGRDEPDGRPHSIGYPCD
jgi:hypothetical protein